MDATTTRASTVSRSMPTRETRTQASMTIPLSRTRSRTSMRLVPPEARSTGIRLPPGCLLSAGPGRPALRLLPTSFDRQGGHLGLQETDLFTQRLVLARQPPGADRQVRVLAPPIQPDLLRLVDGADQEPDPDGEELDLGQRDADVSGDHETLVEHAVEDVDQTCGAAVARFHVGRYPRFEPRALGFQRQSDDRRKMHTLSQGPVRRK